MVSNATFPQNGVIVTESGIATLTNKTLLTPVITTATIGGVSRITGASVIDTLGTINAGATTVTGNITVQGNGTTANNLVLNDKGAANAISIKSPDTL